MLALQLSNVNYEVRNWWKRRVNRTAEECEACRFR